MMTSATEWNPANIVDRLANGKCIPLIDFVPGYGCLTMEQLKSYKRGGVKWNEEENERSFVKDTGAAVTNAEELQAVWQTAKHLR
jgi:hypothetical protein